MALDINDVTLFIRFAATSNLSEAARQLGLTPQIASRGLRRLEQALGVRLVHRTTRRAALTADGEMFLPAAERLLAEAAEAEASVGRNRDTPRGLLRLTAPATFGRKIIAPMVPDLMRLHQELSIDLQLTDSIVDLIEHGIDLAVRIAPLRSSSLMGRKLVDNPLLLVASPAYLAARGSPANLDDLAHHDCLAQTGQDSWSFVVDGQERRLRVRGRFSSNSFEALREAMISGLGIGMHSEWDISDQLADGSLVPITLDDAIPRPLAIWAIRPGARQPAAKVRVFVEALETRLKQRPTRSSQGMLKARA